MTREEAEKAALLLKRLKEYESANDVMRKLYKQASDGNKDALEKLVNIAQELVNDMVREIESKLATL